MVPVQVTSVALYVLLAKIGWVDTYLGILAPNFASAFGVFLIRQGIKAVPVDLIEAARMDGAGEVRIVLTIVAPLVKTTLATVAMILFLGSWNDFLWPVIVINSQGLRTLPVGIALFKDPYGSINYGPLMAATVIATGPMLVAIRPLTAVHDPGDRAHRPQGVTGAPRGTGAVAHGGGPSVSRRRGRPASRGRPRPGWSRVGTARSRGSWVGRRCPGRARA
jgi:ABC-type sulfate transport system permease component